MPGGIVKPEKMRRESAEPKEGIPETTRNGQLCYAHLYPGLYHEAHGKIDRAKEHLLKAAALAPAANYMGKVAVVHCKVRGWKN